MIRYKPPLALTHHLEGLGVLSNKKICYIAKLAT